MNFEVVNGHENLEAVKTLFVEYVQSLGVAASEREFSDLENKYKGPRERLYLALVDGEMAGCVAIREVDKEKAEMKRLYVRPAFRRTGVGMSLGKIVVDKAKELGYRELLLDSLPSMESAVQLYNALGFKKTEGVIRRPVKTVVHLTLPLVEDFAE